MVINRSGNSSRAARREGARYSLRRIVPDPEDGTESGKGSREEVDASHESHERREH